ncbi:adhesion G protein-coupled receptor F4 isoform X2 [Kryptolebias marmoratus]|nr:adhesion G protein-coupled receptor F4 isoform X2 [Kryptolebias marmoratus]
MTTNCTNEEFSTLKSCECMSGHRWSDDACKAEMCCGETSCSLSRSSSLMCISNSTVHVTGKISTKRSEYQVCLTDKNSKTFKDCNSEMIENMKKVYSTLKGFDTLTIKRYSFGSVVVDFEMKIISDLKSEDLIDRSVNLTNLLEGSLELETTGFVILTVPSEAVHYNKNTSITCTTKEDLGAQPEWKLNKSGEHFTITNGTVSTVTIQQRESRVLLNSVNELWEGEYLCVFVQKNNSAIIRHKANATMDICLIPKITVSTKPSFPRCRTSDDVLLVEISCEIDRTNENYTVTWSEHAIQGKNNFGERTHIYTAKKFITCDKSSNESSTRAVASCTFTNMCGQTTSKEFHFEIIHADGKYCAGEYEWEDTKADFTAEIKCRNQAGVKKRKCNSQEKWEEPVSECVNQDLSDVLMSAKISDIGLGELDMNTAIVFSRFNNVTKTAKLNTRANIYTSVQVLDTLQTKLSNCCLIQNNTAVDNFLDSSSNLLNDTLESSWNTTTSGNISSMADTYLNSVETLVKIANITGGSKKSNLEVSEGSGQYNNSVFNVTLGIENSSVVKTTGFKSLHKYLPNDDNSTEINSIVVAATTDGKQRSNTEVNIKFGLLKARPRNVKITCVYRDKNKWSSEGCQWGGPDNEDSCICNHLSSFAVLMSKEPLKVLWLEQVTYVGLGISIVSLFIGLLIELVVWSDVVKTNTLYLRHTAHVNISLCLLVGNACFLASSETKSITEAWCRTSAVLKHFCYLAMFFWMLCLSTTLLHQTVFLFHKVSKKSYLRFSLALGYGCPVIVVFVTFLSYGAGSEGVYYSKDTCWLVYSGLFKGSIYTFVIPVATIVFINVFSMLVVIMKLLSHNQNADMSQEKEKAAAKTVLRSVILLTPIFGVTWVFGLATMIIDLTSGIQADVVNYIFVVLNAFQGLFILLTSYFGDRMTREAVLKRFRRTVPVSSISESTATKSESFKK